MDISSPEPTFPVDYTFVNALSGQEIISSDENAPAPSSERGQMDVGRSKKVAHPQFACYANIVLRR